MYMEAQNYSVSFDSYTERHFVKDFSKRYKSNWDKTRVTIEEVCKRIDNMLDYQRADLIQSIDSYKLVKLDFTVEGTKLSPKASGNRCILVVNEETRSVKVLLVYSKNHISKPNETTKWKSIIKENFESYADVFNL